MTYLIAVMMGVLILARLIQIVVGWVGWIRARVTGVSPVRAEGDEKTGAGPVSLPAGEPAVTARPVVKRRWGVALIGLAMAVICGVLLFPYAERIFDGRTAELRLELAGPHVEVTLNGEKVAVTNKGEAAMHMRPGDYEVVGLKNGQFAGSSIYLLHSGIPLTADNREFDAVRVTGPRTLEYGPGSAPPTIADYTAIQGRWTIISQMKDGHPLPASQSSKWIELDYDLFRSDAPGTTPNVPNVRDTRFSINPSTEPKHIDFVGLGAKGIYRIDGDTLTLAIAEIGHPRPAAFESRYGSPVTLIVCRRESSPVRPLTNANPQTPAASATAVAGLSEVIRFEGHQSWVGDIDVSTDGKLLVSGSGIPEAMVFVWNMDSGHLQRRLKGHDRSVHAVRFSPDGKQVIAAGKGGVIIQWDVATEKELRRFEGHNCWIQTLAWSPDGQRIASGTANWHSPGGAIEVRVWNATTGDLVRANPMPVDERGKGTVLSLQFFPDGKRLLANCQMPAHGVQILDIETGQVVQRLVGGHSKVDSATLSADARFVATGRQATRVRDGVWNDPDNAVVSLWDLEIDKPALGKPALGESGLPLSGLPLGQPSAGRLLRELRGHRSGVSAVSFSPDGRLLASCSGGQFLNDPIKPTAGADHSLRLWDVASGRELLRHDHVRWLSKLRFTPDGRHVVTNASGISDQPDELRLWRIPDRIIDPPVALVTSPVVLKEERRLEGHTKNITGLAFLSQGRAVSTSGDKSLRLWNVATGELLRQWDDAPGRTPTSLAVSADERLAATGCFDGAINVWGLDAEQRLRRISAHTKPVHDLTFTPNGRQLLSVSADETVRVWDVETGTEVRRIDSLKGPRCVAVSPDGRWLVVGCYSWHVAIFNLETAALAKELKAVGGAVLDVTFCPDGRQVAAGTQDGHVVIWDVESEAIVTRLLGHTAAVGNVAFTPDGRFVVSGGDLGVGDQTIRIREVTTGREVARIAAETHILNRFALSPDGQQLLTGGGEVYRDEKWHADGDYALRLWNLPQGIDQSSSPAAKTDPAAKQRSTSLKLEQTLTVGAGAWSVLVSPDGKLLAATGAKDASSGVVKLWDAEMLTEKSTIDQPHGVRQMAFTHDSKQFLTAGDDGTVKLFDLATGTRVGEFAGHRPTCIAVSHDGKRLATGGPGGSLVLWDFANRKVEKILSGHTDEIRSVAFSPDGTKLASGGVDKIVRVWNVETGKRLFELARAGDGVAQVVFSPDGKTLAAASGDGLVWRWNIETGADLGPLKSHTDKVTGVAFHPTGKFAATTCWDGTGAVWTLSTMHVIATFDGAANQAFGVVFLHDGTRIATAHREGVVKVWNVSVPSMPRGN
jgi:uncharacterized protein (TIGR03067 family)